MSPLRASPPGQDHDRLRGAGQSLGVFDNGTGAMTMEITAGQKMISAMSGSLLTSLLVTPLDVVRVRLQSQTTPTSNINISGLATTSRTLSAAQTAELGVTACCREVFFAGNHAELCIAGPRISGMSEAATASAAADCAVQETRRKTYYSTIDGFRKIARNEGITTLWRGLSPTLVMTVPANIIYFTGYDWLRHNPTSPLSRLSSDNAPLVGGSVARLLAATAVSPIELVRTRMQAASGSMGTNHLMETFRGIRQEVGARGWTSLWKGLTLTLWRDVPFSGLYWWGYETIRGRLTEMREQRQGAFSDSPRSIQVSPVNHTQTLVDSFIAGASSGAFASILTMPFDVGKTITQVHQDSARTSASSANRQVAGTRNMAQLLWHIFQTEGIAGLWKGWIPRTLKVAPACAIMISSYEVGKKAFRGANEQAALQNMGQSAR